jgi:hypothetical protein
MAKMTKKVKKALIGSIEKWIGIVKGTEVDRGSDNCPLCALYTVNDGGAEWLDCPSCLIGSQGEDYIVCGLATPYPGWRRKCFPVGPRMWAITPTKAKQKSWTGHRLPEFMRDAKAAAVKMARFLIAILPRNEGRIYEQKMSKL